MSNFIDGVGQNLVYLSERKFNCGEQKMADLKELKLKADAVSVLRQVCEDEGVSALISLLALPEKEEAARLWAKYYGELAKAGLEKRADKYFRSAAEKSGGVFAERAARGENASSLFETVDLELTTLKELGELLPSDFESAYPGMLRYLPKWDSGNGFSLSARKLKYRYFKNGYGIYAESSAFRYDGERRRLEKIENFERTSLSSLYGCDEEKSLLSENTRNFMSGLPFQNALLYGARGTGKSSLVRATFCEFEKKGLRIIELTKSDTADLPVIFAEIGKLKNLRFIVFIDDLTFSREERGYSALKAALEGSFLRPKNAVIYVTSNRRHLLAEDLGARESEVHPQDAADEEISLFDRFGLVITFLSPDKKEFLRILTAILSQRGIAVDENTLALLGERYAMKKGSRSGRTAKQLADILESRIKRGLSLDI